MVDSVFKEYVNSITPKVNLVMNVEYQTMRKHTKSYELLPFFDNSDKLTSKRIYDYFDNRKLICDLRDGTRKNTTINTYFRAVKTFLNFCIDEGFCSPDVLRKVKMLKSDAAPVIPLTNDEVDEIDDLYGWKCESDLRNLCMIHLMLDAGFRSSDVVNLMYSNINFDNNYLYIKGKGDKFRTVILCPKLKKMLSHYLLKYRACASEDDFPVFAKVGTSERINPNVIRQLFTRIKKGSGIERVHPHLLRHTFATSYILGGGNMEYLRMMLGHSNYETTKLYLHLAQEAKMLNYDIYKLDPVFFKSVY